MESVDGMAISAKDMRVRCPVCTIMDSLIKLLMRNLEVRGREAPSRLLMSIAVGKI
jgi:hypothetical protein